MSEYVQYYLNLLKDKKYRDLRKDGGIDMTEQVLQMDPQDPGLYALRFETALQNEDVFLYERDAFGFHRSQRVLPFYDRDQIFHRYLGNITPNYAAVIAEGFDTLIARVRGYLKDADADQAAFYRAVLRCLDAILIHCDKYRKEAERVGNERLAKALLRIPRQPATSFYEACLFQQILLYSLRCGNINHTTLGRFDQYMRPYFEGDLACGVTKEELFETLELFFITLNLDTDVYFGVQQGDNGQSMVLGGFDRDGNDCFCELSQLCMEASLELSLIDPKINLRCGKKTPQERLEYATKMTKQGLGFPQYCNDDVVIPGLIAWGYDEEDAYNYTVAACWEFIIPNCGVDVPNVTALNFPLIVNQAIHEHLENSDRFDTLLEHVDAAISAECYRIIEEKKTRVYTPVPLLSIFVDGVLEKGVDISKYSAKYKNFGCHGAGISNAADALMAVKCGIYDQKAISKTELLQALDRNFEGTASLRNLLLSYPKMGNNNDEVDALASYLMDSFVTHMCGQPNGFGGVWRTGTGSAMEYILSAKLCPATADGRGDCEPYACSFSPAITTRLDGPLSTIASFTKYDLKKVINGGPLTMELHNTVFRNTLGEKKVAALVRLFLERGGHQLQLNSVNRDTLLDAKQHPESYPNLIVRVWGWSGYFCELDPEYQDHIIRRTEFTL